MESERGDGRAGPLAGVRVVEIAGIGPAPFAGMVLADLGAEVLQVDRPRSTRMGAGTVLDRGRTSIAVDLKHPSGVETVLRLVGGADALIEGFRPGVAERLGIGPESCLERNPRLVYGRMTGWGREGPLAASPGHDIDYVAVTGVLGAIGRAGGPPVVPLNVVGDFGGGGMLLALGVVSALVERASSGSGQVVDAAIVDGVALLSGMFHAFAANATPRGTNLLDGGAPFYGVYETAGGGHVAVGAIEPQFYAALLRGLGLQDEPLPHQLDQTAWPAMRERFAAVFRTRTRDEWCALLEGTDACLSPVLSWSEAQAHPHNVARGVFDHAAGYPQPAPAPRFSRTPGAIAGPPPTPGRDTDAGLAAWGFSAAEIEELRAGGAIE